MSAVAAEIPRLRPPKLWPKVGWAFLLLFALLAAANAISFALVPGYLDPVQKSRMFAIPVIGIAHTLGGALASIIGPFQFLGAVRRRFPGWHRWVGRVYLTCVGASALAGLYLAPESAAKNTFGIAFIALALAWLYTGTMAYVTIRARKVEEHRRWMIRNFALTYAAVTLRIEMPLFVVAFGLAPLMALNIVGWFCWVPNLLVVEWWIRRKRRMPHSQLQIQ
jgi:uncharacterized membrane protein